jgi:hypothetical protein
MQSNLNTYPTLLASAQKYYMWPQEQCTLLMAYELIPFPNYPLPNYHAPPREGIPHAYIGLKV